MEKRVESASLKNKVSKVGGITRNVAQSPRGLFTKVVVGGGEEADKSRDGPSVDDQLSLFGGSGSDVSQHPGGFELKLLVFFDSQEGDEDRERSGFDDLSDRGGALRRQHLSDLDDRLEADVGIRGADVFNQLPQLFVVGRNVDRARASGAHLSPLCYHLFPLVLTNRDLLIFTTSPPFSLINSLLKIRLPILIFRLLIL
mmetsp:Transcript_34226/g.53494  ORF Transcript_34226/g.53494 Transcript_34226/m.53494 type:complete len:200 (+) Transcript_34226:1371-1970(+)